MHNQTQSTGADALQANQPSYADNLEGTVTVYHQDGAWHILGRFNGQTYQSRSTQSLGKATYYAREWLGLYKIGAMI